MASRIAEIALRRTESFEGFRGHPYDDHRGNPTIGYGTLLPLTPEEASVILEQRMAKFYQELIDRVGYQAFHDVPLDVEIVLLDMVYNLGVPKLLTFKKMWAALERKDYEAAADEILDSRYAKQVGHRAIRNANKMRGAGK